MLEDPSCLPGKGKVKVMHDPLIIYGISGDAGKWNKNSVAFSSSKLGVCGCS